MTDDTPHPECPFYRIMEEQKAWTVPPDNVEELHRQPCLWCEHLKLRDMVIELNKVIEG